MQRELNYVITQQQEPLAKCGSHIVTPPMQRAEPRAARPKAKGIRHASVNLCRLMASGTEDCPHPPVRTSNITAVARSRSRDNRVAARACPVCFPKGRWRCGRVPRVRFGHTPPLDSACTMMLRTKPDGFMTSAHAVQGRRAVRKKEILPQFPLSIPFSLILVFSLLMVQVYLLLILQRC